MLELTIVALIMSAIAIGLSIACIISIKGEIKRLNNTLEAFEEAFQCNLTGEEPYINVMDYPMGGKIWMVPCRDIKKKTK